MYTTVYIYIRIYNQVIDNIRTLSAEGVPQKFGF